MIQIPQGYFVTSMEAVDARLALTKQQMRTAKPEWMPYAYFAVCNENEGTDEDPRYYFYIYSKKYSDDQRPVIGTGRFRRLHISYDDIDSESLPTINGVRVYGDKNGDEYVLQNALEQLDGIIIENFPGAKSTITTNIDKDTIKFTSEGVMFTDFAPLYKAIKDEEERAIAAEEQLKADLDSEAQVRRDADNALDDRITEEVDALNDAIAQEEETREAADDFLKELIDSEAQVRRNADKALDDKIAAEEAARQAADTQEAQDRQAADTQEATAREQADQALVNDLAAEVTRATNAETNLQTQITNLDNGKQNVLIPGDAISITGDRIDVKYDGSKIILDGSNQLSADIYAMLPPTTNHTHHSLKLDENNKLMWGWGSQFDEIGIGITSEGSEGYTILLVDSESSYPNRRVWLPYIDRVDGNNGEPVSSRAVYNEIIQKEWRLIAGRSIKLDEGADSEGNTRTIVNATPDLYTAGDNIEITADGEISATIPNPSFASLSGGPRDNPQLAAVIDDIYDNIEDVDQRKQNKLVEGAHIKLIDNGTNTTVSSTITDGVSTDFVGEAIEVVTPIRAGSNVNISGSWVDSEGFLISVPASSNIKNDRNKPALASAVYNYAESTFKHLQDPIDTDSEAATGPDTLYFISKFEQDSEGRIINIVKNKVNTSSITPNNPTITLQMTRPGTTTVDTLGTFTLNQATAKTLDITPSWANIKDKPTIPTVNDAKLTLKSSINSGTTYGDFTANQATAETIELPITTVDLARLS